eukprot:Protomagalhaensia_sp_Gyna_25__2289@NODE_2252_length_1191_cov_663_207465_g1867_i0_p1_GENE_NODE_2252_length_1191_cov_663_207465_g1867_i0NODE_2252_length_1191_cov_663_207465_g1867_i0_p1_ORF_typecomplete_len383_score69_46PfkB/PF00294_24/2_9e46KR/PF08659_10/0_22_NODE_2252_length_1191_cov_663_207465_g1867_i0421160
MSILIAGNPILDLAATLNPEELAAYNITEGGYTEYSPEKHGSIFEDRLKDPHTKLIPGGAGQNTGRFAQKMLARSPGAVVYLGAVGRDEYAAAMKQIDEAMGMEVHFYEVDGIRTGTCAAVINSKTRDRSMCTNLGAANKFQFSFLQDHWHRVEQAQILFSAGFFVTASPASFRSLMAHANEHEHKLFGTNLCAPFIIECYKDDVLEWLQAANFVVSNEVEWQTVARVFQNELELPSSDAPLDEVLRAACTNLEWKGATQKPRVFICTQGADPTLVAHRPRQSVTRARVDQYPVEPVQKELIVDTIGCGDSFISGLIVGFLKHYPLEKCIELANICGRDTLQHEGATGGELSRYLDIPTVSESTSTTCCERG